MKNFFSSPSVVPDLQNFSLQLNLIQKELRHQRDDNSDIKRRLTRIIGLLTDSAPVEHSLEEYPEEEIDANKDNPRGN